MIALYALLAALTLVQPAGPTAPLTLDLRVFRGATEVTKHTIVAIYAPGERKEGRRVPLTDAGVRRTTLPPGAYDVQLVQEGEGKVEGIAWSTLRLLADYPLEGHTQLEVLNFDKTFGALQVRPKGAPGTGTGTWTARLVTKDGRDISRGVEGAGYQLLVAPAGTYDVIIERPGTPVRLHDVVIQPNLTMVKTF